MIMGPKTKSDGFLGVCRGETVGHLDQCFQPGVSVPLGGGIVEVLRKVFIHLFQLLVNVGMYGLISFTGYHSSPPTLVWPKYSNSANHSCLPLLSWKKETNVYTPGVCDDYLKYARGTSLASLFRPRRGNLLHWLEGKGSYIGPEGHPRPQTWN